MENFFSFNAKMICKKNITDALILDFFLSCGFCKLEGRFVQKSYWLMFSRLLLMLRLRGSLRISTKVHKMDLPAWSLRLSTKVHKMDLPAWSLRLSTKVHKMDLPAWSPRLSTKEHKMDLPAWSLRLSTKYTRWICLPEVQD